VMRPEEETQSCTWDTRERVPDFPERHQDVVERFVRASPDEIRLLEHWGVPWSRRGRGRIMQRPFAWAFFSRERAWRPTRPASSRCRPLYDNLVST